MCRFINDIQFIVTKLSNDPRKDQHLVKVESGDNGATRMTHGRNREKNKGLEVALL